MPSLAGVGPGPGRCARACAICHRSVDCPRAGVGKHGTDDRVILENGILNPALFLAPRSTDASTASPTPGVIAIAVHHGNIDKNLGCGHATSSPSVERSGPALALAHPKTGLPITRGRRYWNVRRSRAQSCKETLSSSCRSCHRAGFHCGESGAITR